MHLLLKRMFQTPTETIGKLLLGEEVICFTLEDVAREPKIPGETRIPSGTYKIEKRTEGGMIQKYRERFGKGHYMLWLKNVPDFEYVYFHIGNVSENSKACVLTGTCYEEFEPDRYRLLNSTTAYLYLWDLIDTEFNKSNNVYVTILDEGNT